MQLMTTMVFGVMVFDRLKLGVYCIEIAYIRSNQSLGIKYTNFIFNELQYNNIN